MATVRGTTRKKARSKRPAVTFWRNLSPGEFGEEWRIDFGDATYEWAERSLSDLVEWLYEKDYPRRLFVRPDDPNFIRVCDLELSLRGELDAAIKIRKWHERNWSRRRR